MSVYADDDLVAQKLDEARALMNNNGDHWVRGRLRELSDDGKMAYCSVGAIRQVSIGDLNLRERLYKALTEEVWHYDYLLDDNYLEERIWRWNDSIARGWDDVSAAFQRASRKARKRAAQPTRA